MNHSAKFPLKAKSKTLWLAYNPEDENDARSFRDETQAFDHFRDYGKFYVYLEIIEADGIAEIANGMFEERAAEIDGMDWEAEKSDQRYQLWREAFQ